jgi:bacterioferritin
MKGDAKVIEYLNKGLRHEMTAVNQYWLHYRLLQNWGFRDLAKQWRNEGKADIAYAGGYMRFYEHTPSSQQSLA